MKAKKAIQSLKDLAKHHAYLRLSQIASHLNGSLASVFVGLLSAPFLSLFVIPGSASVCGIVIAINGFRIVRGKGIYLPNLLGRKKIASKTILKGIRWSEKHLSPPTPQTSSCLKLQAFVGGWIIFFSGLILAVPLPPGTNIPPAIALVLVVIGLYRQLWSWIFIGGAAFIGALLAFIFFMVWAVEKIEHLFAPSWTWF